MTIAELVAFGARWEDDLGALQATRHFYNLVNGSKLLPLVGATSPDWALEDKIPQDGQAFSYRLMRRYFLKALTLPAKSDRDVAWGLTFQTLGHVAHHLQDMAQPQHVRGDAHCDAPYPCRVPGSAFGFFSPSIYERRVQRATPSFGSYPAVFSAADVTTFNSPRKFWHTNPPGAQSTGKGIAEFTNHNFISAGTNFDKPNLFPSPSLSGTVAEVKPIEELCAETDIPCNTMRLTGLVTFFSNRVVDNYTREEVINPRMTTLSVFDQHLDRRGKAQVFSYNRFNADAAASLLVPRAVGYSAGMINYFFRGDIDLVQDAGQPGTYAIRNNGSEPMSGTFGLYYDDANEVRYLHKSWTLSIPAGVQVNIGPIDFPAMPLPRNADDFMLVFNGDMGEETRTMFGTGAVTAARVSLFAGNALYLTGQDAAGGLVYLRVDRAGTHTLDSNEFHPLRDFIASNYGVYAKATLAKQVEFDQSNDAYRTVAIVVGKPATPARSTSYVFHRSVAKPRPSIDYRTYVSQFNWRATVELAVGVRQYHFALVPITNNTAKLTFARYRITDGTAQQDLSGTVTLPPLPTGFTSLSYEDASRGKLIVSPDGLAISGFKARGANTDYVNFELRMSIGTTVTAAWAEVLREKNTSSINEMPLTATLIETLDKQLPLTGCTTVTKLPVRVNRYTSAADNQYSTGETTYFDVQRGVRLGMRYEEVIVEKRAGSLLFGAATSTTCDGRLWGYRKYAGSTYSYRETTRKHSLPAGGKETFWRDVFDASTYLLEFPAPGGGYTVNHEFEGFMSAQMPPNYRATGPEPVARVDYGILRPLTAKVADAITFEAGATLFRGKRIDNPVTRELSYVADASPLGEVFFANNHDLASLVHEPRAGGIQKVQLPPTIIKLLAATWM